MKTSRDGEQRRRTKVRMNRGRNEPQWLKFPPLQPTLTSPGHRVRCGMKSGGDRESPSERIGAKTTVARQVAIIMTTSSHAPSSTAQRKRYGLLQKVERRSSPKFTYNGQRGRLTSPHHNAKQHHFSSNDLPALVWWTHHLANCARGLFVRLEVMAT